MPAEEVPDQVRGAHELSFALGNRALAKAWPVVSARLVDAEWQSRHSEFLVRGNEAGMILGGSTRAADVAVWRRAELGAGDRGPARSVPVLAVDIAGRDDNESYLS